MVRLRWEGIRQNLPQARDDFAGLRFHGFRIFSISIPGLFQALFAAFELITVTPAVAQKVAVDLRVKAIGDSSYRSQTRTRNRIAAHAAMPANRRGGFEIPFSSVVFFQCFVGKHPGRTDLNEIAAEFVLKRSFFMPPEIDMIMDAKGVKIPSPA